MQVTVLNVFGI